MNRTLVTLGLVLMMLLPSPAFAWFGWLDKLSGPGRFFGFLFEVRPICFGDRLPGTTLSAARESEAIARLPGNQQSSALWQAAAGAWRASATAWSVATGEEAPVFILENETSPMKLEGFVEAYKKFVEIQQDKTERAASVGVIVDLCPSGLVRRGSIDFAMDVYQQYRRRDEFAGGAPIYLTTSRVSYSFPLFRNRKYDVLDMSMGAGAFWFTSRGFREPVRGLFLEPGRFYWHAPSSWGSDPKGWQRALAIPVLSTAAVVYPNGFAENVFVSQSQLDRQETQERIGSEVSWSIGIFVNVHPTSKKPHAGHQAP